MQVPATENHDALPADPAIPEVQFDLRAILKPDEIDRFHAAAKAAGRTITEHFIALTLGAPKS